VREDAGGDKVNTTQLIRTLVVVLLAVTLAMPAMAGKPNPDDGGGKKGGGKGGSGFNATGADQLPVTITFDIVSGDRMRSDGSAYIDSDIDGAPDADLAVHILIASNGNYGNLYLMTSNTANRTVDMDISDCQVDCDAQPEFSPGSQAGTLPVAITVIATEAITDGFCGMSSGGAPITAPMEITYNIDGITQPGFIYFNPGIKGKSPCRGSGTSDEVSIERVDNDTWRVMGAAACVVKPGGRDAGGQVTMPFGFTVDASASCN
jgi:hypothetical protein